MKGVATRVLALTLLVGSAYAQNRVAPDAVTMRVVKVEEMPDAKHEDDPAALNSISEETYGYKMTAVTASVQYELSCVIHTTTEHSYIDGNFHNLTTDEAGFVIQKDSTTTNFPRCTGFHVGERVKFYSLDNLIWLSYTDAKQNVFTHSSHWKPKIVDGDFWTWETDDGAFREQAYHIDLERAITEAKPNKADHVARATRKKQPQ